MSLSTNASEPHPVILFSTVPNEDVGKKLARGGTLSTLQMWKFKSNTYEKSSMLGLVESKLVACVNIVPKITSIYWWDNAVQEDSELLLIMKTRSHLVPNVTDYVKVNHPYDVPEVVSFKVEDGNPDYLKWITDSTPAK
ncbi:hypothetical protein HK104_002899 [Borealophlyctis nickersoniae]|nr:hypothetical protein HK104_002899 [Borealophlyctis nickersoniae]